MAILDPTSNEIVIRVVYDGPPEAGKTTSVRALATSFSQPSHTPEENETGRTQWFDWMEYVGGRFEGSQIRCQIVSVPGQRELGHRREALLATADVIVFVGDTTRERWDTSLEYLLELQRLRDRSSAPIGIVFQANKRDRPDALTMSEIRTQLGDARWEVGLVESVAADGTGIREAFVYAVRLALDRVRELVTTGQLKEGRPDQVSPAELLMRLRSNEVTTELTPVAPSAPLPPAATIEASLLDAVASEAAALVERIENADTIVVDPIVADATNSVAGALLDEILATELGAAPITGVPVRSAAFEAALRVEAEAEADNDDDGWGEAAAMLMPVPVPEPETVALTDTAADVSGVATNAVPAPLATASPQSGPTSMPPIPIPPKPKLALAAPPRPPDATVPSGAIWPPVEGRAILLEVSAIELVPRRHGNGDWSAGLGSGWRLVSKRDAMFDSLDAGRNALVAWARLHTACMNVVSPHRCIVLASTGDGRWRLWQIVRAEESLRDLVERASSEAEAEGVIDSLCQTAQLLVAVNDKLADAPCELTCTLDTIGSCDMSGMYIGLMPEASIEPTRPRPQSSALLASELGPMLKLDLADMRENLGRALMSKPTASSDGILASLRKMLE